jgi:hypothetical protein
VAGESAFTPDTERVELMRHGRTRIMSACRDAIEQLGTDRRRPDPARRGPPSPAGPRGKV